MRFSDLLQLPFDADTGIISIDAILAALPRTPLDVAQQFYSDHARKVDHQEAYASLPIDKLSWSLMRVDASSLCTASTVPAFRRWFDNVSARASQFNSMSWKCIDVRPDVQRRWAERGTWRVPPIVLTGSLVGSIATFHVAEGHTRIGLLRKNKRGQVLTSHISPLALDDCVFQRSWIARFSLIVDGETAWSKGRRGSKDEHKDKGQVLQSNNSHEDSAMPRPLRIEFPGGLHHVVGANYFGRRV